MKPVFAVFNVMKTAFDEKTGLLIGSVSGQLTNYGCYNMYLVADKENAVRKAKEFATAGTVGVIFEMTEALIIKPTPIEIISVKRCDGGCDGKCSCGS